MGRKLNWLDEIAFGHKLNMVNETRNRGQASITWGARFVQSYHTAPTYHPRYVKQIEFTFMSVMRKVNRDADHTPLEDRYLHLSLAICPLQ
jgi:hypothetical protein